MDTKLLYLYHGTSLHDFRMMKATYDVNRLYATDDLDTAKEEANQTAKREQSSPVIIVFDRVKLSHLVDYNTPECFTGNIKHSIIRAYICENGEVGLKL